MDKNRISFSMHKLSGEALGPFRLEMASLLASSPDPFAFLEYRVDLTRCLELLRQLSAEKGVKITLTPLLNKLLASAVFQNPIFNQVVLGNNIYQMEDIIISNGYLVPETEAGLCYVLIKNAHQLSLTAIQEKLVQGQKQQSARLAAPRNRLKDTVQRLIFRRNLLRLAGEKYVFKAALKAGLLSNIVFLNHVYQEPATFKVIKPVITPMKISLRIHAHRCEKQLIADSAETRTREVLPLHVAVDHRIMHGIHAHRFGESLEKIAAVPEKFLM